jgi:hypothetical protein
MARRQRRAAVALGVVAVLAFTGCRTGGQVKWGTYIPTLQQRIDAAAVVGDCRALEKLRRFAEQTSDAHRDATGFPNDALVGYIEDAQTRGNCPSGGSAAGALQDRTTKRSEER